MFTLQLSAQGSALLEVADGMWRGVVERELGDGSSAKSKPRPAAAAEANGWDYIGLDDGGWLGRTGHVAVVIGRDRNAYRMLTDKAIEPIAAFVRDRIPDVPMVSESARETADRNARNPCALLGRADAEAILGKLTVRPYVSAESSPLVDAAGPSCAYFRGHHRVLVITPKWSDSSVKTEFQMAAGFGQLLPARLGLPEQSADTLEGPWDQAALALGKLYFLKGDSMLEVDYMSSGVDMATAVRVAAAAMRKL
jgi:hypothetical protein